MTVIRPILRHVTMRTSRLDEMIARHGAVIGARVVFRDEHSAWTTNDSGNHGIAALSRFVVGARAP